MKIFLKYIIGVNQGGEMNYLALKQLDKRFDQFCQKNITSENPVIQNQLPILKYKYKCRTLRCGKIIQSEVALSKDCHFCVNCI